MGRAYVNEILNADYIQDPDTGLYLVSTWADGDKKFTTDWIPYVRGLD